MAFDKGDTRPLTPLSAESAQPEDIREVVKSDDSGQVPRAPRRRRGGCGCWLTGLFTLFLILVLVAVGLFLPPVQLIERLTGPQYFPINADAYAVQLEGLTLQVDPAAPGEGFSVAIDSLAANDFLAGAAGPEWLAGARSALPAQLALQSPVYSLYSEGMAPETLTLDLTLPAAIGNAQLFSLYGWDGMSWDFLPSTQLGTGALRTTVERLPQQLAVFQVSPPSQPTVLVTVEVQHTLNPEVAQVANIVAPAGIQPTLTGGLTGSLAAGFDFNSGYLVMPVVRNFTDERALDSLTVSSILANRELRQAHVAQLTAFANSGFGGLLIDWRGLEPEQRRLFSEFIRELAGDFAAMGLKLGVVVPPAAVVDGALDTGAYDWRALGRHANYLQVRLPLQPRDYGTGAGQPVELMLRYAVGEVERGRLLAGFSASTLRESEGSLTSAGYAEAHAGLGDVVIEVETTSDGAVLPGTEIDVRLDGFSADAGFDAHAMAPWVEYRAMGDAPAARYWLTTGAALRFRLERTLPYALAGVGVEDLLAPDQSRDLLEAVLSYKLQLPSVPDTGQPALRWRVEGADGVQSEALTELDQGLLTTLEAPDGNYAINVDVVTGRDAVARDGQAIGLFAPTPTPTPTPTPAPTAIPRPAVSRPVSQAPAVAPSSGSIQAGSFEYGGHVTSAGSGRAINAMRSSGMTWMKKQVRHPGGDAGGVINAAKSNGFKVLIGALGDKNQLASRGTAYMDEFAAWLGQVASQGADAIEVWNEPNLDREWPQGQISGAAYADMLRRAYSAIKSANPATMVISGAPAPTGAEAAFPGRVMNDDKFMRQMVNAGAMQWLDCVGIHYNEGIIPPSQTSGDPRDGFYSRYYFGMLNLYWGITGGQKPLCFTELGFLTSHGFGPLPAGFAWAGNVTLQQHAAWLAQSIALSSQSGKVRLLIVWNVDFTLYSSDPQAGYAMIRTDGSCPACSAIAAAR